MLPQKIYFKVSAEPGLLITKSIQAQVAHVRRLVWHMHCLSRMNGIPIGLPVLAQQFLLLSFWLLMLLTTDTFLGTGLLMVLFVVANQMCGESLRFTIPLHATSEEMAEKAEQFIPKLSTGHDITCPWRNSVCDTSLGQYPAKSREVSRRSLHELSWSGYK